MVSKSKISETLLKELGDIDTKHESGQITNRQHNSLSKKAVGKAFKELLQTCRRR